MTSRTDSRIRSTPSPARKASSSSDTTDWDNAIGGNLLVVLGGTHRESRRWPHHSGRLTDYRKPTTHRTLTRDSRRSQPLFFEAARASRLQSAYFVVAG